MLADRRWIRVLSVNNVITQQVLMHKLHVLLAILKMLVREKLSLTLPMGLV
jgi:hypothetical protein